MMKKVFLLLLAVWGMCLPAEQALRNGSFEDALQHWTSGTYLPGKISTEQVADGKRALLIEGDAAKKFTGVMQDIPAARLPLDRLLRARVHYMIERFDGGIIYPVYFQIFAGGKIHYLHKALYPTRNTGAWQQAEVVIDRGKYPNLRSIRPMVLANGDFKGRFYVDSFTIEPYRIESPLMTVGKGGKTLLNNFFDIETGGPAVERTEITVHHDGQRLYFSGIMTSFALDAVSNQLDAFKARCTRRDDPVWEDDCVEIRLRKQGVANAVEYYFGFNAAGALCDMRRGKDMWDDQFQADAKLTSRRESGRYLADLDIAMKSLDMKPGEVWEMNIIRFDQPRKKRYSLAAPTGDHQSWQGATRLRIGEENVSFKLPHFTEELLGGRTFSVEAPADWEALSVKNGQITAARSGRGTRVTLPPMGSGNSFQLRFSAPGGTTLFHTPLYPDSGTALGGTLRIPGAGSITVHGRQLGADGKFTLQPGENVVTAQLIRPMKFAPELLFHYDKDRSVTSWQYQSGNSWLSVPADGMIPGSGPVTVRRRILREATALLPLRPDQLWRVTANGNYALLWAGGAFAAGTYPKSPYENFALVLDVPPELEFAGVGIAKDTAYYIKKQDQPKYRTTPCASPYPNWKRYRIEPDKGVTLSGKPNGWLQLLNRIYFGAHLVFHVKGRAGTEGQLFLRATAEQGNVLEAPVPVSFRILPELRRPKLEKMVIMTYDAVPGFEDEKLNRMLLDTLRASGVNEVAARAPSAYGTAIGLKQMRFFHLAKRYFDPALHRNNPELNQHFASPYLLSRLPQEAIDRAVAAWAKECPHQDYLFWDYEYGPFPKKGALDTYSLRHASAFKAFAERHKITEPLNESLLSGKYRKEWIAFSCEEVGRMVRTFGKAAKKVNRKLLMYSGYQSPLTQEHYTIDWSAFADVVERGYCGYGHDLKLFEATKRALGGKPLVTGLLKMGSATQTDNAAAMFRKALDGGAGVLLWYEQEVKDALTFAEAERCAHALAGAETFMIDGKRRHDLVASASRHTDGIAVFSLGKRGMIALFNEGNTPREMTFTAKGFSGTLQQHGATGTPDASRPCVVTVPAGGIEIFTGTLR